MTRAAALRLAAAFTRAAVAYSEIADIFGAAAGQPQSDASTYTTLTRAEWPPGARSRRHARDKIKSVPDHERHETGPATWWSCSREAYHHHTTRPVPRPSPTTSMTTAGLSLDELAELVLSDPNPGYERLRTTRSKP